jgi:hypothetical protein
MAKWNSIDGDPQHRDCERTATRGRLVSIRWRGASNGPKVTVVSGIAISSASQTNANHPRRAGVSSCGADRVRRLSWTRPFRRTRQAIDRSLRLIEESGRVIEAAERFAAHRPLRAAREYERVSGWLDEATAQLLYAVRALTVTTAKIALSPAQASDAPPLLLEAAVRWAGAAGKLAVLSNRLDDTFDIILDAVAGGTPLDFSQLFRKPIVTAQVIRLRPVPERRLSSGDGAIYVIRDRRRRSVRITVAEAARRIFRGRAPPLAATCPL